MTNSKSYNEDEKNINDNDKYSNSSNSSNNNNSISTQTEDINISSSAASDTLNKSNTSSSIDDLDDNPNNKDRKNVFFNMVFQRRNLIHESIRKNNIFWIISIICVILLSYQIQANIATNIWYCICGVITYIVTILLGYLSHYISHHNNFVAMYEKIMTEYFHYNIHNNLHQWIIKIIDYTMDYHDVYHHNSEINKQPLYLFLEVLNNIWMQGGCWILYIYIFSLNINTYNILLWCLVYSSFHNINYNLMECPLIHQEHHKDIFTNIGIDIVDVIFNSKYDDKNIEDINHYAINTVFITVILLYYKYYF